MGLLVEILGDFPLSWLPGCLSEDLLGGGIWLELVGEWSEAILCVHYLIIIWLLVGLF